MGKNVKQLKMHCCDCGKEVQARLTDGSETYPHRVDLYHMPFWKCDHCGNFVGCHYKTKDRTRPLGHIPSLEIKRARMHIHALLDPMWQSGGHKRSKLYALISERIGWKYHTAKIKTLEEAREVYSVILKIKKSTSPADVKG